MKNSASPSRFHYGYVIVACCFLIMSVIVGLVMSCAGVFYKNMFAKCPAGRPGTADEIADVAELLMSPRGAFITGADFLIDGSATASFFYGPLKPEK